MEELMDKKYSVLIVGIVLILYGLFSTFFGG